MALVKVQKTRAYFKRYQVKFRRRREGKTDYFQRKRLIAQDKDKYNSRKYRLIVRLTNRYVICQIAYATIAGDVVVSQANSKELVRYGIKVGLNNYAAAYATGLLLARRHLTKLGIASCFVGCNETEKCGEDFENMRDNERGRPFKAILDIGLARSTTGAKCFGAMKGALDGGINVPHSPTRFVGNKKKDDEAYNAKEHRDHIMGVHVANYMKHLQSTNQERYKRQFSEYIKANITHDKVEEMYKTAHEKIRENPSQPDKKPFQKPVKPALTTKEVKKRAKAVIAERRSRINRKKQSLLSKIKATA